MIAIDLYKFVEKTNSEYHWENFGKINGEVRLFILLCHLDKFNKLFSPSEFDDGGVPIVMMDGYVGIEMASICENNGIELLEIFPVKDNR